MKKLIIILLLSPLCSKAQTDSSYSQRLHALLADTTWQKTTGSIFTVKDSCWWTPKVDTIQTGFVITVDENNFVKKTKNRFYYS